MFSFGRDNLGSGIPRSLGLGQSGTGERVSYFISGELADRLLGVGRCLLPWYGVTCVVSLAVDPEDGGFLRIVISGTARWRMVVYMGLVSAVTPAGVITGLLASSSHHLLVGVMQGLAAGTLLYITFFEVSVFMTL